MLMLSMLLNLLFLNSNYPLILGFILICQVILISLIMGTMNFTFWMSYIIFLVFIGGMLILFMYVISLINNIMKLHLSSYMLLFTFVLTLLLTSNKSYNNNNEMLIFNKFTHSNNENSLNLLNLFNMPNLIINMMLITYLFIMMIVVTKITNFYMGPFSKY